MVCVSACFPTDFTLLYHTGKQQVSRKYRNIAYLEKNSFVIFKTIYQCELV